MENYTPVYNNLTGSLSTIVFSDGARSISFAPDISIAQYRVFLEWLKANDRTKEEWLIENPWIDPSTTKAGQIEALQAQLDATDGRNPMARGVEDVLDILKAKSVIQDADIPLVLRTRIANRKALRAQIQALKA